MKASAELERSYHIAVNAGVRLMDEKERLQAQLQAERQYSDRLWDALAGLHAVSRCLHRESDELGWGWVKAAEAALSLPRPATTQCSASPSGLGPKATLLDPEMPAQEMRLHAGELTSRELLVARAVIRWANSAAIRWANSKMGGCDA